jgi:hypothetical protein
MHRSNSRTCCYLLALVAASGVVASQGGCKQIMTTAVYLYKGTDVDPEFPGLKDKTVAIVCHPAPSLQFGSSSVATEIAAEVGRLLKSHLGKKIKVIPARDVDNWIDENSRGEDDFADIGNALEADMVLGIDLEAFELSQGQTLWQGQSQVRLKVLDMSIEDERDRVVFDKIMPHVVYPPKAGVPVQERSGDEFRRQYVSVLADTIGRYFYPHDRYENIAQDARAFN